ncbi:MAG TPA: hypothetical protein ENI23_08825 [bacterium]|nr:hypothetical protein [bacterium]
MVVPALIAGGLLAARFVLPRLIPLGAKVLRFVAPKTVKGAIVQAVVIPTGVGFIAGAPSIAKQFLPGARFKASKEFGQKLTGEKPADGGDLIKSGLKAAGVVGGVVAAVAVAKKIKEKLPARKEKVITSPEQIVPPAVLPLPPEQQPLGPVKQVTEEKIMQPTPSIINKINVTPIVNVRINQSKKFINQQLLIRA